MYSGLTNLNYNKEKRLSKTRRFAPLFFQQRMESGPYVDPFFKTGGLNPPPLLSTDYRVGPILGTSFNISKLSCSID